MNKLFSAVIFSEIDLKQGRLHKTKTFTKLLLLKWTFIKLLVGVMKDYACRIGLTTNPSPKVSWDMSLNQKIKSQ